jgi:hypothetical protein
MVSRTSAQCVSCGSELAGEYCHACGERVRREPPTLLRFIGELVGEALDADGRIIKTARTLAFRPGRLTVEYLGGRRKPYLGPAAIFVVMNVLFFFVQPIANVNTFHATLQSQTNWYPYSAWAGQRVQERLAETGASREDYRAEFDVASERYARTLIFLQVPLFALGMALLQVRRRRYFVEHLVYATHFFAFILFFNVIASIGLWAYWALGLGNSFNLELPFILLIIGYSIFALRDVYGDSWISAIIKGVLILILSGVVVHFFRFILFLAAFATAGAEG